MSNSVQNVEPVTLFQNGLPLVALASLLACNPEKSLRRIKAPAFRADAEFSGDPSRARPPVPQEIRSVIVNVRYIEVRLVGAGRASLKILSRGLGPVDLLRMHNGIIKALTELDVPDEARISQIRLVLENDGNYIVCADRSVRELRTSNQFQKGIRLKVSDPIWVHENYTYSAAIDFEFRKSITLYTNGGFHLGNLGN